MTQKINNHTNVSAFNLNNFKVGQKKDANMSKLQQSIFDSVDKNKDGILSQNELNNVVTGKMKSKNGGFVEAQFIKIGNLENERSLVMDKNGKQWVMAKDGSILKQSYVDQTNSSNTNTSKTKTDKKGLATANYLAKSYNSAQKAFDNQMKKDGWAGDVADGVSRAWTWATDSKNSANYVREDLQNQKKNVQDLQKAAQQGESEFKAKFKEIYGVEYNQQAMDSYMADPSPENYKKAFGSKVKDIKNRVDDYNKSQDTGATAVKTTAKVGAGVAIGVVTGGTGVVALGAAAAATAAASVVVEETDALKVTDAVTKGKVEFREGTDHKKILTDSAWDGASVLAGGAVGKVAGTVIKGAGKMAAAGRTAINVSGDVAVGAAQEYVETGKVTAGGVVSNAVMSGVGGAVTSGVLSEGYKAVKKGFGNVADNVSHRFSTKKADLPAPTARAGNSMSAQNSAPVAQVRATPKSVATANTKEPMAVSNSTITAQTKKSIPMNQQVQVSDNILVLRQTNNLGTIVIDGKPKTLYVKRGESITYKDAAGNNIIARQDLDGNFTIETTSSSTTGINKPTKTWSLSLNENRSVKISKDKAITLKGECCFYGDGARMSRHKLNPGETKIIDKDINGNSIILSRDLDGKYRVSNGTTQQPKINSGNVTTQSLPKIEDLTAMRRKSPNAYNHLEREELEKLRDTNFNLYHLVSQARRDVPNSAMSEQLLHAIQLENQGRTLVTNLDSSVDLTQISKHVDNGGVFSHNGKLYVNDAGQSVELNLSQEKFEELFPPIKSAFFQQGNLGDCWFVSSLSAQMDVPKGRVELYKRFKQSGEDVIVTSSGKADVVFKGGKCLVAPGIKNSYAKGLRMIEQTTAVHRTSKEALSVKASKIDIADAASIASKPSELMKRLDGGFQSEGFGLLGDFKVSSINEMKFHETLSSSELAEMKNKILEIANDSNIAVGFVRQTLKEDKIGLHGNHIENNHAMKIVGCHNGYVEYVNQNYFTSNVIKIKLDDFVDKYLSSLVWTDFSPGGPLKQVNFNKIIL